MLKFAQFVAVLTLLLVASVNASDTVVVKTGWTGEYNTNEVFYSTINNAKQELTLECLSGQWNFGYANSTTGDEANSHDNEFTVIVDGQAFKLPLTPKTQEALYNALANAKNTLQYVTDGVTSTPEPVQGLATMIKDVPYKLSHCTR